MSVSPPGEAHAGGTSPVEVPVGMGQRIIQIHPLLTCNLRCTHCYSNSSPAATGSLDLVALCEVLTDAAALGYTTVAISGGEPLLYRGLDRLLEHAKALGMRTSLTTNGTLLQPGRLAALRGSLDLMAISLDGPPALHNEMRASDTAFERLQGGIEHVRDAGIPFGILHTITRRSWEHLVWVADFAATHGAALLQLHPLELTGRAELLMRGAEPDEDILTRAYLLSLALADQYLGTLTVQFDAFRRDLLRERPELVYATDGPPGISQAPAAELLGLLVVEADGTIVPISYGVSHRYRICQLPHERLGAAWPRYAEHGYRAFRELCRAVHVEATLPSVLPFFDWHAMIVARSHTAPTLAYERARG